MKHLRYGHLLVAVYTPHLHLNWLAMHHPFIILAYFQGPCSSLLHRLVSKSFDWP